jgi:hypothetical protein
VSIVILQLYRYPVRMVRTLADYRVMLRLFIPVLGWCGVSESWAQECSNAEFFSTYTVHEVGSEPVVIEIADIDADGDPDIIVPNSTDGDLSILLNHGDGRFAPQIRIPVGQRLTDLAIADLNSDGALDFAVSDWDGEALHILLNSGGMTYNSLITLPLEDPVTSVVAEDFDEDGDIDLAAGVIGSGDNLFFLRNELLGIAWTPQRLPLPHNIRYLRSGDIDHNGTVDILVDYYNVIGGCRFASLLNQGAGLFASPTCETIGPSEMWGLALGDIDGDEDLDIVFGHYNEDDLGAVRHRQDGNYVNLQYRYAGGDPAAVALGDIDLDGDADAAVANENTAGLNVLYNNGTGLFGSRAPYGVGGPNQSVALHDLDADGDLDIILGSESSSSVRVLMNNCDPVFCYADLVADGQLDFFDVSVFLASYLAGDSIADFNGDGTLNFFDVSAFLVAFNAGCP